MCGIAGIYLARGATTARAADATAAMCRHMRQRGPDSQHVKSFSNGQVVLGHRRLAILDLDSRADQPMVSPDGRLAVVLNGEIYNYRSLRKELEREGVTFRTNSDTEVVLHLYARRGPEMLDQLRGMFAIAVWDESQNDLFLARDPYGIKPLYFAEIDGGFAFASQVKALLKSDLVSRAQDNAGLAGFYLRGHVPEPFTLYSAIKALPSGHWMHVRNGQAGPSQCWHDIRQHWHAPASDLPQDELAELVRAEVANSVAAHLVSDVPVSVFLSGGIDSAAVAGHVTEQGAKIEAVTLGFEEFAGQGSDEVPLASEAAQRFGLSHRVRTLHQDEFSADLPQILDAMDQPSVDGLNSWFASKAAAERGYKVVLSGVGGDELFCAYQSFRQIPKLAELGRMFERVPGLRPALRPIMSALGRQTNKPKLAALLDHWSSEEGLYQLRRGLFLPHELPNLMGDGEAADGLERLAAHAHADTGPKARNGVAQVGLLESTSYLRNQLLRDSDWASMAHSLELRTPLVDAHLLRSLGRHTSSYVDGKGKALLARSPKPSVPASIIERRKTGFSVPMAGWLAKAAGQHLWSQNALVEDPRTPWARRWAFALQQQNSWRAA